jgi:hypothetical protein
MQESRKLNIKKCRFIFYQRKIHFLVFNMWVIDMSFYSTRSILHLKNLVDFTSMFNCVLSHLVMIIVVCDLLSLFLTAEELQHSLVNYHSANLDERKMNFIQSVKRKFNKRQKKIKK